MRMQGLPRKLDRTQRLGPISIPRLPHECVPVKPGLQPDLVPAAGDQPDFNERRATESLNGSVVASRLLPSRIARVRLLLNQLFPIPNEVIGPRSSGGRWMAVHNGQIHAFRFATTKLILEPRLRLGSRREDDES